MSEKRRHIRGRSERRLFPRYSATGLSIRVNGEDHPVVDISLGGLLVNALVGTPRKRLSFALAADDGGDGDGPVPVIGMVVRQTGDTTAIAFQNATLPLLQMVVRQASRQLGVDPYLLK